MELRLKRNKDFQFLFNRGSRSQTGNLIIIYHKARGLKVGYSVSKKHGKAFLRNKIKRLIRASIVNFKDKFNDNYYVVIVPKVLEEYSYLVFLKDLEYTLKKGKLING